MVTKVVTSGVDAYTSSDTPNKAFGGPALLAVKSTGPAMRTYLQLSVTGIPANAIVSQAYLEITPDTPAGGTPTLDVRPCLAQFDPRTLTHANAPAVGASLSATQVTGAGPWRLPVTADLPVLLQGGRRNYGWRIASSEAVRRALRGFDSRLGKPRLVIDYEIPAARPTNLVPNGRVVSISHPTLTFTVPPGTVAVEVQISADPTFASGVWSSGRVASTVGVLALASTSYAGIPATDVYIRAAAYNTLGMGPWSDVATTRRVPHGALVVTNPGATDNDATPPVIWTFTPSQGGGAQTQYRLLARAGSATSDSGWLPGGSDTHTPSIGPTTAGQTGTLEVQVRDSAARAATPGDPDYVSATKTFTLSRTGPTRATSITATQDPGCPVVDFTITTPSVPDELLLERDGVQVLRVPAVDVRAGSDTTYAVSDWTADPQIKHTWRVLYVSNGAVAADGPTVTLTPHIGGIWILDPDHDRTLLIVGRDEPEVARDETIVVHKPFDTAPVVRRYHHGGLAGTVTGQLASAYGRDVADEMAAAEAFAGDLTIRARVVWASRNVPATVYAVNPTPRRNAPTPGQPRREFSASFVHRDPTDGV